MRAHSDAHFKEAVAEAAALILAKSTSPSTSSRSPLQKTLWTGPWQRRQTTRTTRPCQTCRLSRRLIDMPAGSGVCTPDVELGAVHRIALGVWRWTASMARTKNCHLHHITSCSLLSRVSVVSCVVSLCCLTCPVSHVSLFCVSCPGSQTVTKKSPFCFVFFAMASKSVDTR